MRRTLLLVFVSGCGSVALEAAGIEEAEIVGGSRGPSVVQLTAAQKRAIGAVLFDRGAWVNECTGTLVAPGLVLTAAHCVEDSSAEEVAFAVGNDAGDPIEAADVADIWIHAGYDPDGDATNDVAVLELAAPLANVTPIRPNCEPLPRSIVGERVQLAGYGTTEDDEDNTHRFWATAEVFELSATDLAVTGDGEQGMCDGDSGGPALWSLGGEVRIVGTLSWGNECGYEDWFARTDDNCDLLAEAGLPAGDLVIEGVSFTSAQASATLQLANTAPVSELDDRVGLDSRAANGIAAARPIAGLGALAAVPYVGASALTKLRDYP